VKGNQVKWDKRSNLKRKLNQFHLLLTSDNQKYFTYLVKSVDTLRLNYRGEPLLHPKIIEMIRYCKERTFARISLSTNGTLLDTKVSGKLISAGIDEIIFSLDANSPEIYYKIKGSKEFDKVVKNIIDFLKMNINNNVRIIIKLIQMDMNKYDFMVKNPLGNINISDVRDIWNTHKNNF